jgi:membrane peptidoglycan carboxypeptidase
MSAAKRENDPGREALENEFRAMFAERSEMVRVKTAPYAAVRGRIAEARRTRRMRIGGAGVAFAMAVVGVGVWAGMPNRHHAAVAPTSNPSTGHASMGTASVKVLYSDGHTEISSPLRDAALDWLQANYKGDLSGTTVITTFDRDIQNLAEQGSSDNTVTVLDSRTGAVVALAGQWQAPFAIGDLMKPIVLAAAFKNYAYNPDSKVALDTQKHPLYFPVGAKQALTFLAGGTEAYWPPESPTTNIQDIDVTLRQAAEIGANEPFARVALTSEVTPSTVRETAVSLGMLDSTQSLQAVPSIVLGSAQATPLTMADVYATLADGGVRHDPRMVTKIVGASGKTVWTAPDSATAVLPPTAAHQVTDVLHSALVDGTTGTYAGARNGAGADTWAMAGAAADEKAAWFDGAESHYVVSVTMAQVDENGQFMPLADDHHGGPGVGSRLAGPIWASLVQTLRNRG